VYQCIGIGTVLLFLFFLFRIITFAPLVLVPPVSPAALLVCWPYPSLFTLLVCCRWALRPPPALLLPLLPLKGYPLLVAMQRNLCPLRISKGGNRSKGCALAPPHASLLLRTGHKLRCTLSSPFAFCCANALAAFASPFAFALHSQKQRLLLRSGHKLRC
jgi:hypothetical protein